MLPYGVCIMGDAATHTCTKLEDPEMCYPSTHRVSHSGERHPIPETSPGGANRCVLLFCGYGVRSIYQMIDFILQTTIPLLSLLRPSNHFT
jgi:hypothetical protein